MNSQAGPGRAEKAAAAALACTAALLCASCSPAPPEGVRGRGGSLTAEAIRDFARAQVLEGGQADPTARYLHALVDLDGDGIDEAIVYVPGRFVCGSGGCPLHVLAEAGAAPRLVSSTLISHRPVKVLRRTSHGWRHLSVWVQGGGIQPGYQTELPFDGRGYPHSAANPPARRLEVPTEGEVVISAEAEPLPVF